MLLIKPILLFDSNAITSWLQCYRSEGKGTFRDGFFRGVFVTSFD